MSLSSLSNESPNPMHEVCSHSHKECTQIHDVHMLTSAQVQQRLLAAKQLCQEQGVRFTPLRSDVYQLVMQTAQPIGAYELLEGLQAARQKASGEQAKMVAPPTIYRTLDFLLDMGLVHQLSSINAFVPCCHPRDMHNAVFLLCTQCQRVQEYSGLPVQEVVGYVNDTMGFEVQQSMMELQGVCQLCVASS